MSQRTLIIRSVVCCSVWLQNCCLLEVVVIDVAVI